MLFMHDNKCLPLKFYTHFVGMNYTACIHSYCEILQTFHEIFQAKKSLKLFITNCGAYTSTIVRSGYSSVELTVFVLAAETLGTTYRPLQLVYVTQWVGMTLINPAPEKIRKLISLPIMQLTVIYFRQNFCANLSHGSWMPSDVARRWDPKPLHK